MMYLLLAVIVLKAVVYWLTDTDSNDKIDTHSDERTLDKALWQHSKANQNIR